MCVLKYCRIVTTNTVIKQLTKLPDARGAML